MNLSNYQQSQQGLSAYDRLQQGISDPPKTRRVGGVRRRDETRAQMQQRLYGQNNQEDSNDMSMIFPGSPQQQGFEQNQENDMIFGNQPYQKLPNYQQSQQDQSAYQNLPNYQQVQQGQSAFQKLQQTPFGQSSSTMGSARRAGGVRRRDETRDQMRQRLGQYGSLVNG